MASENWYFYLRNGQQRGPVSSKELVELVRDGKLSLNDRIRRQDSNDWLRVSQSKKLTVVAEQTERMGPGEKNKNSVIFDVKDNAPLPVPHESSTDRRRESPDKATTSQIVPPTIPVTAKSTQNQAVNTSTDNDHSEASVLDKSNVFRTASPKENELTVQMTTAYPDSSERSRGWPNILKSLPIFLSGTVAGALLMLFLMNPLQGVFLGTRSILPASGGSEATIGGGLVGGGSHVTTEEVCLYEFPMGQISNNAYLIQGLRMQDYGNPLYSIGKGDRARILSNKTALIVLKTDIIGSDPMTVHFVRVSSGEHKGKEGWISDKYMRVNL